MIKVNKNIYIEDSEKSVGDLAYKLNIITGQEVETDIYVNGKKVYVKRIDCGTLPSLNQGSYGQKTIDTGLDFSQIKIIWLEGIARLRTTGAGIPMNYPSPVGFAEVIGLRCVGSSNISIFVGTDRSNYDGEADIYYTKD